MLTHECPEHGRYDITHDTCPICAKQKSLQDGLAKIVHKHGFTTSNGQVRKAVSHLISDIIKHIDPGASVTVETFDRKDVNDG
jgi:hypothetical protein